jgi:hypothetical protein
MTKSITWLAQPIFRILVECYWTVNLARHCWNYLLHLTLSVNTLIYKHPYKVKQSRYRPGVAQRFPGSYVSQITSQRQRMVVRLSALNFGSLYPAEMFLVLIYVRGWVDPRATGRSEGLCQWKIPVTPSGIELEAFRFVAQYLNHCATISGPHTNVHIHTYIHVNIIFNNIYSAEFYWNKQTNKMSSNHVSFYSRSVLLPQNFEVNMHCCQS